MDAANAQKTYGQNLIAGDENWEAWSNGLSKRPFERCKHGNVVKRQIIGLDKNEEEWWDEKNMCLECEEEREIANKIELAKVEAETAKGGSYDKREDDII